MLHDLIPIVLFVTVGATIVGLPIARAFARRIDREGARPAVPSDVSERLARMEQSIDAIAVEVERISEAQRFTTRLLSQRTDGTAPSLPPSTSGTPAGAGDSR